MNTEELEQIKQDIKAVYNVMYNFDDRLCDDMQVRVKRIETLLTAYEKEKETSHYIQSQLDIANAKLVEETEIIKNAICFLKYYNKDFNKMSDNEIKQILYGFGKCADIKKEE